MATPRPADEIRDELLAETERRYIEFTNSFWDSRRAHFHCFLHSSSSMFVQSSDSAGSFFVRGGRWLYACSLVCFSNGISPLIRPGVCSGQLKRYP